MNEKKVRELVASWRMSAAAAQSIAEGYNADGQVAESSIALVASTVNNDCADELEALAASEAEEPQTESEAVQFEGTQHGRESNGYGFLYTFFSYQPVPELEEGGDLYLKPVTVTIERKREVS